MSSPSKKENAIESNDYTKDDDYDNDDEVINGVSSSTESSPHCG